MGFSVSQSFLSIWICIFGGCYTDAHKFLLYPINLESHILIFSLFGAALTEKGHNVDLLVASNAHLHFAVDNSINMIQYPVRFENNFHDNDNGTARIAEALDAMKTGYLKTVLTMTKQYDYFMAQQQKECEDLLQNNALMTTLAQQGYDYMVLDNLDVSCGPAVPYKLNVPIVLLSTPGPYWKYRIPALPSVSPHVLLPFTESMTFTERCINLIEYCIAELYIQSYASDYYVTQYVPERPNKTGIEIMEDAALVFISHYDLLQFPLPSVPWVVQVGDLSVRDPTALSNEYRSLLKSTKWREVFLVSMGSLMKNIPNDVLAKFCDAFRLLDDPTTTTTYT